MSVYVAVGHGRRPDGSFDPGATDGDHSEQKDAQVVAETCAARLRDAGLEVISEADQADDPNFYGTTEAANNAGVDCVVSFHYDWNQAPPGAFAIATTDEGRELGWAIEARVAEAGFSIRDYPDDRDGLYLLDNSHAPAVIFECGRIGHSAVDEPDEQKRLGTAAALGILDWLGEEMVDRNTSVDPNENLMPNYESLVKWGVMSKHTQPGGVAFNDEVATFFKRYDARVKRLIAAAVAGGASTGAVIAEIIDRLGG